jgi:hypothetical protein
MNIALGTVASATALASSSILAPAMRPTPDPIFPVLEVHGRAWAEVEASIAAMGAIEDSLGDDGADHARISASKQSGEYLLSHEEIDQYVDRGPWPARGAIAKRRAKLHAEFDAEAARLESIAEASGLKAARAREAAAWVDWRRQVCVAVATVPTTAPGVAAFVDFMREQIFCERGSLSEEIDNRALQTLSEATKRLAGGAASSSELPSTAAAAAPPSAEIARVVRDHQAALAILDKLLDEQGTYEKSGVRAAGGETDDRLDEKVNEASRAEMDAAWNVISIVPKTATGLAALLRYVREDRDMAGHLEDKHYLWMLYCSIEDFVCDLAGLPGPETPAVLES